eukprot:GHVL01000394.1.p1 GENE.GHVL01000394.1~~GHVL01000394.1.p1  ORF type:complete len:417 (+),score=117.86 GHVL01000394.1:1475-2725(+)
MDIIGKECCICSRIWHWRCLTPTEAIVNPWLEPEQLMAIKKEFDAWRNAKNAGCAFEYSILKRNAIASLTKNNTNHFFYWPKNITDDDETVNETVEYSNKKIENIFKIEENKKPIFIIPPTAPPPTGSSSTGPSPGGSSSSRPLRGGSSLIMTPHEVASSICAPPRGSSSICAPPRGSSSICAPPRGSSSICRPSGSGENEELFKIYIEDCVDASIEHFLRKEEESLDLPHEYVFNFRQVLKEEFKKYVLSLINNELTFDTWMSLSDDERQDIKDITNRALGEICIKNLSISNQEEMLECVTDILTSGPPSFNESFAKASDLKIFSKNEKMLQFLEIDRRLASVIWEDPSGWACPMCQICRFCQKSLHEIPTHKVASYKRPLMQRSIKRYQKMQINILLTELKEIFAWKIKSYIYI